MDRDDARSLTGRRADLFKEVAMRWGRVRCSFCGKDRESVAKLVSGRNAYICDACVGAASRIIEASNHGTPRTESPATPSG